MAETQPTNIYEQRRDELYAAIADAVSDCRNLLDFGCGDCELSVYLAKRLKVPVQGIDIARQDFSDAFERVRKARVKRLVDCRQGDAERLADVPDKSFSCAVSKWVLHELAHPVRALREIRRVLLPGGKIVCCDFTKNSLATQLWGERYFTPGQAAALLKRAGFVRVSVLPVLDGHAMLAIGHRRRA